MSSTISSTDVTDFKLHLMSESEQIEFECLQSIKNHILQMSKYVNTMSPYLIDLEKTLYAYDAVGDDDTHKEFMKSLDETIRSHYYEACDPMDILMMKYETMMNDAKSRQTRHKTSIILWKNIIRVWHELVDTQRSSLSNIETIINTFKLNVIQRIKSIDESELIHESVIPESEPESEDNFCRDWQVYVSYVLAIIILFMYL